MNYAMLKAGKLSPAALQAALDVIERERAELVSSASRSQRKAGASIIRVIPQSAQLYREAVRNLTATLTEPMQRQEARALIAKLLGGQVKVRQEGEAVYARLEMDAGVLAVAGNSNKVNDFKRGSGGVSWVSHTLDFVDVESAETLALTERVHECGGFMPGRAKSRPTQFHDAYD